MSDVLDLIDNAVGDWETSRDAMRWTPDPPKPTCVEDLRGTICQWLVANSINLDDVPIHAVPDIRDGRITCPVYVRRDGTLVVDEDGEVSMGSITVPLIVEPPEALTDWLAGTLPTVRLAPWQRVFLEQSVNFEAFYQAISAAAERLREMWRRCDDVRRHLVIVDEAFLGEAEARARIRRMHTAYHRRSRARARRAR